MEREFKIIQITTGKQIQKYIPEEQRRREQKTKEEGRERKE